MGLKQSDYRKGRRQKKEYSYDKNRNGYSVAQKDRRKSKQQLKEYK